MLVFAPGTRTFGVLASTASAGSFCLFCENGEGGLTAETRVSGLYAEATVAMTSMTAPINITARKIFLIFLPFRDLKARTVTRAGLSSRGGTPTQSPPLITPQPRLGSREPFPLPFVLTR